eukprot:jgi/Undpi1/6996/HiC_scaffold_21.g09470.m1
MCYVLHAVYTAQSKSSTGLKNPGSGAVEALPYPAKRLSKVQEVQEWTELHSSPDVSDSSPYIRTGGGMRGGIGASSARDSTTKKVLSTSTLSDPLLQWGDGERNVGEDGRALESSSKHNNDSSAPAEETKEQPAVFNKATSGFSSTSLGGRGGLQRQTSSGMRQISMRSDVKSSQIHKRPLATEGEGSVFPIALPITKRPSSPFPSGCRLFCCNISRSKRHFYRRAYEVRFIQQFDRLAINANGGEFWTIIDATWINNWVDFVMGNKPSPGPISNYKLYNQQMVLSEERRRSVGGVLASHPDLSIKEGLQIGKDYRAIHPLVWFIFREVYDTDGAPDIFRWKSDVYSDEVTGVRKGKMVEEIHTKAVYELRRFSSRLKDGVEASTK